MSTFTAELWTEYAIGTSFMLLRFYTRFKVVGLRNFDGEDAFMFLAMIVWCQVTVFIHLINSLATNVGLTTETAALVPAEKLPSMILGSKLAFADWALYMVYVWSLKGVLLCLYSKLTRVLPKETLILRGVAIFTVIGFVISELTHICQCLPVQRGWRINPYPGDECSSRNLNYYVIGIINATTDACIICIPIPILFKTRLSVWRRLLLALLLCSGIFVIIATIMRAYYSLKSIQTLLIAMNCASREMFVAATAVSIPGIKPLVSKASFFKSKASSGSKNHLPTVRTIGGSTWGRKSRAGGVSEDFELRSKSGWRIHADNGHRLSSDGSEDFIMEHSKNASTLAQSSIHDGVIHVTSEFRVSHRAEAKVKHTV